MTVIVVLAATGWMGVARIIRGEVQGVRTHAYVDAAVTVGVSSHRVLWRHVLPMRSVPRLSPRRSALAMPCYSKSGLSFLGLGIQPRAELGNMIAGVVI